MALSESRITELYNKWKRAPNTGWRDFARAIEAEVRKQEREAFALECIDLVAFHGGSVEIEAAIRDLGGANG